MTVREALDILADDTRDIYQLDIIPTGDCKLRCLQVKQFENKEVLKIRTLKTDVCDDEVLYITYLVNGEQLAV